MHNLLPLKVMRRRRGVPEGCSDSRLVSGNLRSYGIIHAIRRVIYRPPTDRHLADEPAGVRIVGTFSFSLFVRAGCRPAGVVPIVLYWNVGGDRG